MTYKIICFPFVLPMNKKYFNKKSNECAVFFVNVDVANQNKFAISVWCSYCLRGKLRHVTLSLDIPTDLLKQRLFQKFALCFFMGFTPTWGKLRMRYIHSSCPEGLVEATQPHVNFQGLVGWSAGALRMPWVRGLPISPTPNSTGRAAGAECPRLLMQ